MNSQRRIPRGGPRADLPALGSLKARQTLLAALCGCGILLAPSLQAEEGGSGHYVPGSMSSFVDAVPPKEAFIARYNMVYYSWYQQLSGDSGSGATFGAFEAQTTGFGPVLSYVFQIGKVDMIAETKWLHGVDTTKRLEGNTVWFKLVAKF